MKLGNKEVRVSPEPEFVIFYEPPGIDSKESIPPAFVAWPGGTPNKVVVPARQAGNRFPGSLKCLQIRAQCTFDCGIPRCCVPSTRINADTTSCRHAHLLNHL